MFLIKCNELNEYLVEVCESIIQDILGKVSTLVYTVWAGDIRDNVKNITE